MRRFLSRLLGARPAQERLDVRGRAAADAAAASDATERLLADRIVFLGAPIDDEVAWRVIAQLLFLADQDARAPIRLYLISPGGSVTASFAIHDAMRDLAPPVGTCCLGLAAGTAALLLAAGARGQRFVTNDARVGLTRLSGRGPGDVAARFHAELLARLVDSTGVAPEAMKRLVSREAHLGAEGAVRLGFADDVIAPGRPRPPRGGGSR